MKPRAVAAVVAATASLALLAWWWTEDDALAAGRVQWLASTNAAATPAPVPAPREPAASALPGAPLSALGQTQHLAQQQAERALWQQRLERSQQALDAYRAAAQYPHESRPAAEHPDQLRPFAPIAEARVLRQPGGTPAQNVRLQTTQERVFASGNESLCITVTLQDTEGRTLPLRVLRALQKEVTAPGSTPISAPFAMPMADDGQRGDAAAGDGVFTAVMQPATQGFANFAGTVRLELNLEYQGQPGFLYFDLVYSPEVAATWLPGVREAQSPASLDFFVKAQVLLPGRYVLSGRIDDANGQPVAVALFNGEVAAGAVEFRLPVFGKLIRDQQPAFPLTLRDVDGFLLRENTFPDRVMLARRVGAVHTSKSHVPLAFSDAEWDSAERTRYLTELSKDVAEAQQQLQRLGP